MFFEGFGERFPYTNFHDLNLDWIIKMMIELSEKVDSVVSGKIIIANPIQWDITKQYQELTVVMDNGTAYLSMKAVPYGVDITNTEYWQEIFNVEDVFDSLKSAISSNDDGNSTTSSKARKQGELLWLNDVLKRVTADMTLGETYSSSNTEDITIEELLVANRLVGKKIAIYGDSWVTDTYGTPWFNRIETLSKASEVHHVGLASATLTQIYNTCWDSYNADIYIIAGGLNDVTLNTGADTFMLAIANLTTAIRAVNANAEIYFITPPKVDRHDFLRKKLPPDFYRTCIWRLSNTYDYHVINGLKWVDIKYVDGVHPTTASAPIIGDYIYSALLNFGDEESHIIELCSMGRETSDVLLMMENGLPYFLLQGTVFTPIESDGSAGFAIDIGTNISSNQYTVFGKGNHTGAKQEPVCLTAGVYGGSNKIIALCPNIVETDATTITIFSSTYMLVNIPAWQITVNA